MTRNNFWAAYALILIAQLLLSNYFTFTPWMTATVLPAMVLCIPSRINTIWAMVIAFLTGLAVDILAEGIIGLNSLALTPVALIRTEVIDIVFGADLTARKKDFSLRRNGTGPVTFALAVCLLVFLSVYIWADAAGTRTFGFNLARIAASFVASIPFGLLSIRALASTDSR